MKIAVLGGNGQLGTDGVRGLMENGDEVHALSHSDLEIANSASVRGALENLQPRVIVNTTAMHHVENCEVEPEKAYAVNALGARSIAGLARDLGAVLIHVSTDYVFDGSKRSPYEETDCPQIRRA